MASIFAREIRLAQMGEEGSKLAGLAPSWNRLMSVYIVTDSQPKFQQAVTQFARGIQVANPHISVFNLAAEQGASDALIQYLKDSPANPVPDFDIYPNLSISELLGYWGRLSTNLCAEKQTRAPGTPISDAKPPAIMIYSAEDVTRIEADPIGVEALSIWSYLNLPVVAILGSIAARVELFNRYRQPFAETVKVA